MKLEYFQARSHALEQFGEPAFECPEWITWRPSRLDLGLGLLLLKDGLFCFQVNGNRGARFRPDYSKMTAFALRSIIWTTGFSWSVADNLAKEFGTIVEDRYED